MKTPLPLSLLASLLLGTALLPALCQESPVAALPSGVKAEWDAGKAWRETTPTRERICLNGLWRWQPAKDLAGQPPGGDWGFFKVPDSWPGITDYMQKDSQTVHAHPNWKSERLSNVRAAWHQREIAVPREWAGRRIALAAEYLNSLAVVYLDGRKQGEIRFPAGELDLTEACRPGETHLLTLLVVALPLKEVMLTYRDTNTARETRSRVQRRGLCGDVFLVGAPAGPRIADLRVDTSVRRWQVSVSARLDALTAEATCSLRARITREGRVVREFASPSFKGKDLEAGRITFTHDWKPDVLWDIHTPQNTYEIALSLLAPDGRELDVSPRTRFGFREFWIDGRDFYLNGSRIFLCAVPLDNAQIGAALASYAGARESLERLKSIGINFVYTHNYDCQPGAHLSFAEILRAADDAGMLVALSQPHFSNYDWKTPDADQTNGYAPHAAFYARVAQNHPSVVAYSMSHNATGYGEDMNPDLIDGVHAPRESWGERGAQLALRAEAIVRRLDPSRIVYHHSSGNLSSMHTINFYPNFVPPQELSDWFEHWAITGVKPAFMCEYGAPFTWDWTMYRGWYKGKREFGSAVVPWEFCLAEWNAQFLGPRAYQISKLEADNLRWEARQLRGGKVWHRWDYPHQVGSRDFDEQYPVFALYLSDNWPRFRAWGVSAISPWEYGHYWKPRAGVVKRRQDLTVDWAQLQRPGFSADFIDNPYERMDLAYRREDWIPTAAAEALLRYNRPVLAFLGGPPDHFTTKEHNFLPGETVEKQLIVINNSRETVTCESEWTLGLPKAATGGRKFTLATGQQERLSLRFQLPTALAPGQYELRAAVRFSKGGEQADTLVVHVLPKAGSVPSTARIALFDPKGESGALLERLGVRVQRVEATADLAGFDMLVVGKAALTTNGPAPDISRVREGLRVLMFEQTADALEKRFGFRVAEYGLRNAFPRVPDHPALASLGVVQLRDWRGEATLLPARLQYEARRGYGPTVNWCGISVTRLWRCGNRGNVASVLIEKPVRGDFLPVIDGGFGLQYSPLMEYREGRGLVVFCQMDVTGRTEADPAAGALARNLLRYVLDWKPSPARRAIYAGTAAGRQHLEAAGIAVKSYAQGSLSPGQVLIVGPGGGEALARDRETIAGWLKAGGHMLALGVSQPDADGALPFKVTLIQREHIATHFDPQGIGSALVGVSPADLHNRDPRPLALVSAGATGIGDGVLAVAPEGNVVFCQLAPWDFEPGRQRNLKRTFQRASFTATRLLANLGVQSETPLLERFHAPLDSAKPEQRWLNGFYLDQPEEWDDPYRFFRW